MRSRGFFSNSVAGKHLTTSSSWLYISMFHKYILQWYNSTLEKFYLCGNTYGCHRPNWAHALKHNCWHSNSMVNAFIYISINKEKSLKNQQSTWIKAVIHWHLPIPARFGTNQHAVTPPIPLLHLHMSSVTLLLTETLKQCRRKTWHSFE